MQSEQSDVMAAPGTGPALTNSYAYFTDTLLRSSSGGSAGAAGANDAAQRAETERIFAHDLRGGSLPPVLHHLTKGKITEQGDSRNLSPKLYLPVILAGGGFRHQGHVVYNRRDNMPLSNLFVRMMQQTGIETRSFGSSTGVLGEV